MKTNCLFCRIIQGVEKANRVYEDEETLVIEDAHPRAPYHYLILPKKHFDSLLDIDDRSLMGKLIFTARKIAQEKGFASQGFRLLINCGEGAGQTVYHLHIHLLGGMTFSIPDHTLRQKGG